METKEGDFFFSKIEKKKKMKNKIKNKTRIINRVFLKLNLFFLFFSFKFKLEVVKGSPFLKGSKLILGKTGRVLPNLWMILIVLRNPILRLIRGQRR